MSHRAVVAAWVGSSNSGDELVFSVLCRLLSDRGVMISAPSLKPKSTTAAHGVETFGHLNLRTLHRQLKLSEALVFGGGGILQDETGIWNLPYHLARIRAAQKINLPWAGIGLGAEGIKTRWGGRQVASVFTDHKAVSVRDEVSALALEALGVKNVTRAADLAWLVPPPVRKGSGVLAVCLRGPQTSRLRPGSVGPPSLLPNQKVLDLAKNLDKVGKLNGFKIRFIALDPTSDSPVHRQVAERMAAPTELVQANFDNLTSNFSDVEIAITMRYHGAIAASLAGAGVVTLPFSPKLNALVDELKPVAIPARQSSDIPEAVAFAMLSRSHLDEVVARLKDQSKRNTIVLDRIFGER